jgi:lipid A 3-O-deacylase
MLIAHSKKNAVIVFIYFIFTAVMLAAHAGQLNVQLENDGLFANDGNYTNGFSLSWESKPQDSNQQSPLTRMPTLHQLQYHLRLPITPTHSAWGLKISQRMWTPNVISVIAPQSDDRPYAGLLEIESHTVDYGPIFAQKIWLALGITGHKSKAEYVQTKIHALIGSTSPLGWQNQVQQQITLQFAYELDALLFRSKTKRNKYIANNQWEVSSYSHIALGNFNTEASLGLLFRWGKQLDRTFGRLSSHFGHTGNTTQVGNNNNVSVYSRLQLGYRFNDLTIEGKLPYESHVNIQHEQVKAAIGINWIIDNYSVTWSLNSYSNAYSNDKKSWHSFGSLTLSCAI